MDKRRTLFRVWYITNVRPIFLSRLPRRLIASFHFPLSLPCSTFFCKGMSSKCVSLCLRHPLSLRVRAGWVTLTDWSVLISPTSPQRQSWQMDTCQVGMFKCIYSQANGSLHSLQMQNYNKKTCSRFHIYRILWLIMKTLMTMKANNKEWKMSSKFLFPHSYCQSSARIRPTIQGIHTIHLERRFYKGPLCGASQHIHLESERA